MSKRDLLFQTVFGSSKNDGKLLLEAGDQLLSKFVYNVACEESFSYTTLNKTSDEKVQSAMKKVDRVIDLFENAVRAKKLFLVSFKDCSPLFKDLIKQLRGISKFIENTKICSKVVSIISGIVGTLAAIALCLACPPVGAPVAVAALAATGVGMAGASIMEHCLKKKKFQQANDLIRQIEGELETMAQWLEYPKKLETAFGTLIDNNILIEVNNDLKKFFSEKLKETKMTTDKFKSQFKEKLQFYMKKMTKDSKISELDEEIGPIIKTFLIVCLIKDQDQFVLESIRVTMQSAFGALGLANCGQFIGDLIFSAEGVAGEVVANLQKLFVPVAIVINIVVVASSVKELTKTSKLAQEINEAVEKFEKSFLVLESIYNRLQKFQTISESDIVQWTTVIVNSVPLDAQRVDIKKAVKPYLLEEAHGCIKLDKLPTNGNNWLVTIPKSHSQQLLKQDFLEINKKHCKLTS